MTRPRVEIRLGVIVRTLVLVLDKKTDGRAQGHTMLNTRLEVDKIFFVPLHDADVSFFFLTLINGGLGLTGVVRLL